MASESESKAIVLEAEQALETAYALAMSEEMWTKEEEHTNGDICYSRPKPTEKNKKVFRISASLDIDFETLVAFFSDDERNRIAEWNDAISEAHIIAQLDSRVKVVYQKMKPVGPGGIISARDFVVAVKSVDKADDIFAQGGCSVQWPGYAKSKCVRGLNGPHCQVLKKKDEKTTELIWMLDCDFKGWLPARAVTGALPQAQFHFVECVRKLALKLKNEK